MAHGSNPLDRLVAVCPHCDWELISTPSGKLVCAEHGEIAEPKLIDPNEPKV